MSKNDQNFDLDWFWWNSCIEFHDWRSVNSIKFKKLNIHIQTVLTVQTSSGCFKVSFPCKVIFDPIDPIAMWTIVPINFILTSTGQ